MKTAVLISGHMRSFATCIYTLRHHVLRHYLEPSFFVSTVRDEQADSWKLLEKLFPEAPVYVDVHDSQPDIPEPAEPVRFEPYSRSVSIQAVLRQLWQLNECWKLYLRSGDFGQDVFIRTRPDLFFHSFRTPPIACENEARTPWWGRFGGINDRFAICGPDAARAYHTTFARLDELITDGCPIHPESLVAQSLRSQGCYYRDSLRAEFSTLRVNGESRPPEVSPFDLAHAALVG